MSIRTISIEDGKYELRFVESGDGAGTLCAYRNGEPWRDLTGDKMVLCLMQKIESLQQELGECQVGYQTLEKQVEELEEINRKVAIQIVDNNQVDTVKWASGLLNTNFDNVKLDPDRLTVKFEELEAIDVPSDLPDGEYLLIPVTK